MDAVELWERFRAKVPSDFLYADFIVERAGEDNLMRQFVWRYVEAEDARELSWLIFVMGMRLGEVGS